MKKLTYFGSLLWIAVFGVVLGACRSDEMAMRQTQGMEVAQAAQAADTFSLQLDFPSIDFDSKVTAVSEVAPETEGKRTRASLAVQRDGTTQLDLSTDGTTAMTVMLILRNQDGSKVYVSPNNQWNLVNGQRTRVEASGIYSFTGVKGATGAPTWTKDDVWYLDAMTGGEWDAKA